MRQKAKLEEERVIPMLIGRRKTYCGTEKESCPNIDVDRDTKFSKIIVGY